MATLDQFQTTSRTSYNLGTSIYGTRRRAQTFTPENSGNLTELHIWIYKILSPADLVVEIRTTLSGTPTSTILASQQISASSITNNTELIILFDNPCAVSASTMYAVVLKQLGDGGSAANYYRTYGDQANNYYSGGAAWEFDGSTWTIFYTGLADWWFKQYYEIAQEQQNITSDALIIINDIQQTINSNSKIKLIDIQQSINSDAYLNPKTRKSIYSNSRIFLEGEQKTISSDALIIQKNQEELYSDACISIAGIEESILSDAYITAPSTYDVDNKITFLTCIKKNIDNKISFVKQSFKNSLNFVNFFRGAIKNINNDIRTKGQKKYNISNDIRLLKSWQYVPPVGPGGLTLPSGFQSLGKAYIKVYIDSVEQTDANIDSGNIHKILSGSATASFDLGRPYDSTKPAQESFVEIKYNGITLYSGYIVSIIPSDSPESISINCKDKYWKNNKDNKYFYVDYKVGTKYETYYNTIASALQAEFSWNPGIGVFMPEPINCWAKNYSDSLAELIKQCGNYEFYYDEFENKQLWTSGEGSIINLKRQELDKNIELYDIISMRFSEDASSLVNKYRVHTGTSLQGKQLVFAGGQLLPAWSAEASRVAKPGGSYQFGCNYFPVDEADTYAEAFKKYSFSAGGLDTSDWSDQFPPRITIWTPISYGLWTTDMVYPTVLTEGFSVDWENKIVTFSEPMMQTLYDQNGNVSGLIPLSMRLIAYKINTYNYIENPGDDPEVDNSNPYVFFTGKMGDYPETILKTIELSQFSIQEGHSDNVNGEIVYVPAWNDIPFATDYANWQLSQNCDVSVTGEIEVTIDAMIYYNIKLKDRIYIDGVTDVPLNIESISYNLSKFTATLSLKKGRYYKRTESFGFHGEKY